MIYPSCAPTNKMDRDQQIALLQTALERCRLLLLSIIDEKANTAVRTLIAETEARLVVIGSTPQ